MTEVGQSLIRAAREAAAFAKDGGKREAEDMRLARAAYLAGWNDSCQSVKILDPRVILSVARAQSEEQ